MILEARDREALARGARRRRRCSASRTCATGRSSSSRRPTRRTRKFDDEKSEFLGYAEAVAVARGLARRTRRASPLVAQARAAAARQLPLAAPRSRMARHPRQLQSVVAEHGWRINTHRADVRAAAPVDARRGCSATSASRATRTSRTSARAASASGAIRARASRRSRGAGSSPPSWSRRLAFTRAASPRSSPRGCPRSPAI